ncbi:TPA: magnesium transporter CorA family protein [Enterococcus faecalis]|nr:magnesium transporter CorA family protein [Enterococcus faecalis]HDH7717984.1 magnesium transporter CorA family protein [Enterococcus faecalis]HDH7720559.1 magnesium transporter CorA family protein [Enterococcus faecalis]HDH7723685.1 magnesium transporter CorA family protein [Enterococcus faecalis]
MRNIKFKENVWIHLNTNDNEELEKIYSDYDINLEVINYTLDVNERARLEYDKHSDLLVLIYNVPNKSKTDNHYETTPITFIVKNNTFITITKEQNEHITLEMEKYLEQNEDSSIFEFLFNTLFVITDKFFPYIEEMNTQRKNVNTKLREKTSKKNLLLLSDLETGIVFFVSASKQNVLLLEQITTHSFRNKFTESEKEELEDVLIEAKQVVEMTQISSEILRQLSGTYNNVLNNNLNDTMRVLTVLSVLLTIPTIITGFFGMNMPLPLEHNASGWIITIVISIFLWFGLSFILRKLMK